MLPPRPRSWPRWWKCSEQSAFPLQKAFQPDAVVLLKILHFLHQALGAGRGIGIVLLGLDAVHHALTASLAEHFGQIAGRFVGERFHADAHFGVELCHDALALSRAAAGLDGGVGLLIQFPVEVPLPQELGPEGVSLECIKYTASNDIDRLEKMLRNILKQHGYRYFVESEKHGEHNAVNINIGIIMLLYTPDRLHQLRKSLQ